MRAIITLALFCVVFSNASSFTTQTFIYYGESGDLFSMKVTRSESKPSRRFWNSIAENPAAIDVDQKSSTVYVATNHDEIGMIYRLTDSESPSEFVIRDHTVYGIKDIAVDYISKNIYWTNSRLGQISVCDFSGRFRRTIAWKNIQPTKIVISSKKKLIFFVNRKNAFNYSIMAMSLDGNAVGGKDLVDNLYTVTSLTIDHENERLYWAERSKTGGSLISSINFDGTMRQTEINLANIQITYLFVRNGKVYYADSNNKEVGYIAGSVPKTLHENININGMAMFFDTEAKEETNVKTERCSHENNLCPEICLDNGDGRNPCYCGDLYTYDTTSKKCHHPPTALLLARSKEFVLTLPTNIINPAQDSNTYSTRVLPMKAKGTPLEIVLDLFTGYVFYLTDYDSSRSIHFAHVEGEKINDVEMFELPGICQSFISLSLDNIGRNLYASCRTRESIHHIVAFRIMNQKHPLKFLGIVVDGRSISKATKTLPKPTSIVIVPKSDALFYLDSSERESFIVRCKLNGKMCTVWVEKNLSTETTLQVDFNKNSILYSIVSGIVSTSIHRRDSTNVISLSSPKLNGLDFTAIDDRHLFVKGYNGQRRNFRNLLLNFQNNRQREIKEFGIVSALHMAEYSSDSEYCESAECYQFCRFNPLSLEKHTCGCIPSLIIDSKNPQACVIGDDSNEETLDETSLQFNKFLLIGLVVCIAVLCCFSVGCVIMCRMLKGNHNGNSSNDALISGRESGCHSSTSSGYAVHQSINVPSSLEMIRFQNQLSRSQHTATTDYPCFGPLPSAASYHTYALPPVPECCPPQPYLPPESPTNYTLLDTMEMARIIQHSTPQRHGTAAMNTNISPIRAQPVVQSSSARRKLNGSEILAVL